MKTKKQQPQGHPDPRPVASLTAKANFDKPRTDRQWLREAARHLHAAAEFGNGLPGSNAGTWETLAREIDAHLCQPTA